jgi:hypothetical protein
MVTEKGCISSLSGVAILLPHFEDETSKQLSTKDVGKIEDKSISE